MYLFCLPILYMYAISCFTHLHPLSYRHTAAMATMGRTIQVSPYFQDSLCQSGVIYEIVSNIPKVRLESMCNAHEFDFKVLRNLIDMLVTCKILLPQQRWGNNILGYLLLVHVHVVLSEVVITLKRIRDFFLKFYLGRLVSIYVIIIRYVTGIESPGCTARFE